MKILWDQCIFLEEHLIFSEKIDRFVVEWVCSAIVNGSFDHWWSRSLLDEWRTTLREKAAHKWPQQSIEVKIMPSQVLITYNKKRKKLLFILQGSWYIQQTWCELALSQQNWQSNLLKKLNNSLCICLLKKVKWGEPQISLTVFISFISQYCCGSTN